MIKREAEDRVRHLATKFPAVAILGVRQAGKSTLAKMAFPDYDYVSLEDPDVRSVATSDPRGFLTRHSNKVILDEVQRAPELFSYLQTKMDSDDVEGNYILSGSRNFELMQNITQSLAGRVAILNLMPLSRFEFAGASLEQETPWETLFTGSFPRVFHKNIAPTDYFPTYIQTYLERDVRNILNVGQLDTFRKFMSLCAGRIGNILNYTSLASDAGIDVRTAKKWISVLEESYIAFTISPYFNNFNKRLVKAPKLYFCDTGLACSLLGLTSAKDVYLSPFRGALFENFILLEHLKRARAKGLNDQVWFWHETQSNEVDFIYGAEHNLSIVEVKSGETFDLNWFNSMQVFSSLAKVSDKNKTIVYAGNESYSTSKGEIVSWRDWA